MRFHNLVILVGLLLALLQTSQADVFKLFGGAEIKGEILKEKPDSYIIDLGFDIIVLPKDQILEKRSTGTEDQEAEPYFENLFEAAKGGPLLRVEELVQKNGESVVEVRTRSSLGSGFLIHPEGYLITNHHVIAGDTKLVVTLFRRQPGKGKSLEKVQYQKIRIVAMDPNRDLALLKIDTGDQDTRFPHVKLGDSDELIQGQQVFAVGSPLGFERTVSKGIVSLPARIMNGAILTQTTTQINSGNSGGPLFNLRGHVIGVNDMKIAAVGVEGVGFAIPSSVVKMFLTKRDAFAFDPRNPNAGYRYLDPPRKADANEKATNGSNKNPPTSSKNK